MKKLLIMCLSLLFLCMLANPALSQDTDGDGIPDSLDNCPTDYNPVQGDSYPPNGNGCGDACECEGNFDNDQDQDGGDAFLFKTDFGRNIWYATCEGGNTCNGDFDCDGDVDAMDIQLFKTDFGRSQFSNPCGECFTEPYCSY